MKKIVLLTASLFLAVIAFGENPKHRLNQQQQKMGAP
jgi:hypothetical protein